MTITSTPFPRSSFALASVVFLAELSLLVPRLLSLHPPNLTPRPPILVRKLVLPPKPAVPPPPPAPRPATAHAPAPSPTPQPAPASPVRHPVLQQQVEIAADENWLAFLAHSRIRLAIAKSDPLPGMSACLLFAITPEAFTNQQCDALPGGYIVAGPNRRVLPGALSAQVEKAAATLGQPAAMLQVFALYHPEQYRAVIALAQQTAARYAPASRQVTLAWRPSPHGYVLEPLTAGRQE
jgi:hypothetical protein